MVYKYPDGLTQTRSCAMARLPMAQANKSGVRTSRGLTLALVTSDWQLASMDTIDLMSARITASMSCCPGDATFAWFPLPRGVRNSLASYLLRIQRSFSSWLASAVGLTRCRVFDSHTEFAKLLPIASMTLRCGALEQEETISDYYGFNDATVATTYGQSSRPRERTLEMCEPRLRCIPEHSMHMSTPRFKLAHSGSKDETKIIINLIRIEFK